MKKLLLILLASCAPKTAEVEKKSGQDFPVFDLEEIDLEELPEAGDSNDEEEESP